MATEVLLNIDHTYQHDLESFFYVLLWQCGRPGWEFARNQKGRPTPTLLTKWYSESYKEFASIKRGNVDANGFGRSLAKVFPPEFGCVKPLCRELRGILFPIRGNAIFTGTPMDPDILYGPVIKAFDKANGTARDPTMLPVRRHRWITIENISHFHETRHGTRARPQRTL